jgi:hypothetical protein
MKISFLLKVLLIPVNGSVTVLKLGICFGGERALKIAIREIIARSKVVGFNPLSNLDFRLNKEY